MLIVLTSFWNMFGIPACVSFKGFLGVPGYKVILLESNCLNKRAWIRLIGLDDV